MAHLLNIQSSPRASKSASIRVADHFLDTYRRLHPETTVDTLNVWDENLPDFDQEAIGAKYKGAAGDPMDPTEAALWDRIQTLAHRFQRADRIVLGVPMWNFTLPYKLKQLIDLACQRNLLFTFDGTRFGPKLNVPRAFVVFSQGQSYSDPHSPTPAATFDFQTPFIEFWLRFIGVHELLPLTVSNTWTPDAEQHIQAACEQAATLAARF